MEDALYIQTNLVEGFHEPSFLFDIGFIEQLKVLLINICLFLAILYQNGRCIFFWHGN